MPEVSIIMVAYNRDEFISEAIESILSQSYTDWELILIDDCSTDNTRLVMERYAQNDKHIRLLFNEQNLGIYKTRAKGLAVCRGKLVAVLDSDDIWCDPDKLKKQVSFLESNPEYVLVGGMAKVINENGKEIRKMIFQEKDKDIRENILLSNQFVHSTTVFKKDVAEVIGGYGEYGIGEDYDLFLKMGLKGKVANLPEFVASYRWHLSGATWKSRVFSAKEHLKIIKKYKGKYPNFYLALLKARLRILFAYLTLI